MKDEYLPRISRLLKEHAISTWSVERRGKHKMLTVIHAGRTVTHTIPLSGSDWRGPRNAIAQLRRDLGLTERKTAHV